MAPLAGALTQVQQERHLLRRAALVVEQQRGQVAAPLSGGVGGNGGILDAPLPLQLGLGAGGRQGRGRGVG